MIGLDDKEAKEEEAGDLAAMSTYPHVKPE